jgi:cation transport ATPase
MTTNVDQGEPTSLRSRDAAVPCPSCGVEVDPLRAPQVGIFGGRFVYFCGRACKADYVAALGPAAVAIDAQTAEPPPAALAALRARSETPPPVAVSVRADVRAEMPTWIEADPPAPPASAAVAPPSLQPREQPLEKAVEQPARADEAAEEATGPTEDADEPAPRTMRSPPVGFPVPSELAAAVPARPTERPPPPPVVASANTPRTTPLRARPHPRAEPRSMLVAIDALGLSAALFVPVLAVARGEPGWGGVALVASSFALLLARLVLSERRAHAPHPVYLLWPALLAAVAYAVEAARGEAAAARIDLVLCSVALFAAFAIEAADERAHRTIRTRRQRIDARLDIDVDVARGESKERVHASEVKPGQQVLAQAGDIVGVDGLVVAGEAVVVPWFEAEDAALEVTKREGDPIVAGARLVSGRLRIVTTWSSNERAWVRLARSVRGALEAGSQLPRVTRLSAERLPLVGLAATLLLAPFVGLGVPAALAVGAAVGSALAFGGAAAAVALSYARAHLRALEAGVVYRDAAAFDRAGQADRAVLCARGTLLTGEPEIVAIESLAPSVSEARILSLAAAADAVTAHPFASAVLRVVRTRGERPESVRNATMHAGQGLSALAASGERIVVGSRAFLLQQKVSVALADARVSELEAEGRSVVLVAFADRVVGLLALQDGMRAGARAAVQRLLDARIEPVLLSSEARETCETLSRALDVDHIRPEVLSTEAGAEVRALAEGAHVVAVVGHPAHDDGALAAADVSVAMAAAGASPGEWSVALASDDVRDAALAITIARRTRDRARVTLAIGTLPGFAASLLVLLGVLPLLVAPCAAVLGGLAALVHAKEH